MTLSCDCPFYYGGYDSWYYYPPDDYEVLNTNRAKRCCSCKKLIKTGDLALQFERARGPKSDVEENIYGTEVPLASWWMCEPCADMYFSLIELGFCILLGDGNMRELTSEYAETYIKSQVKNHD